ncbi:MAG: thioredoxin domain-containing protein, partial [Chlorobi bacterium]|nr:thioredoxin domain-containing protein [Chlorobiota bacterium]
MSLPQPQYERDFEMPDLAALPPDGGPRFNRLVFESSPYLLQHADNLVDWYPWGDEAFEKAQRKDRPVFLSIGYSTCHWCHVMEHESFEDSDVAEYLNKNFIAIKVDREERPDIDHVYMTVCQALTGSGGWPLTVFMTPERKPFFAGTYFPREGRFGRPGFLELLKYINDLWINDRDKTLTSGTQIVQALSTWSGASPGHPLDPSVLVQAEEQFKRSFDVRNGGFGGAPKFPMGHTLSFLLRRWKHTGDTSLRDMALHTLRTMYNGGIYDHLGFGFARYSTDAEWLVPHFEKMLYDQALLLRAYTDAYQVTHDPFYARVVREIATYVHRDMTDSSGGFHSAENADSEGKEGSFYTWNKREILDVLGEDDGRWFCRWFGVTDEGNFEQALNILHVAGDADDFARELGVTPAEFDQKLNALRNDLFIHRRRRIHPSKDDKVLTSWNGLMISSLARSGFVLNDSSLLGAAADAADFILANMVLNDNTILHRWRNGKAGIEGYLEDYTFFVDGLLELYQATFDIKYLVKATQLHQTMMQKFLDPSDGTLFSTAHNAEQLIVRPKDAYDGALPSGNSMAAWNSMRIAR